MKQIGYYNGKLGPLEEMTIPMNDRASYFGDGVYEAVVVADGVPFALEDHFDRFYDSLRILEIPFTMSREALKTELMKCVAASEGDYVWLYWQCSRGTAVRDHVYPGAGVTPNLTIMVMPGEREDIDRKMKLTLVEDIRWQLCNVKTLNLIPSVMASEMAKKRGCDEAVLHRGDIVTECAHSNILLLKDGVLRTHPADNHILPGISRKHLLEMAPEHGIPVEEIAFTIAEMMEADEIIVSSSGTFCASAVEIDRIPVGGKDPERLTLLQQCCLERFSNYISQK